MQIYFTDLVTIDGQRYKNFPVDADSECMYIVYGARNAV